MSADEDDKNAKVSSAGPQGQRNREKPPVTIDLTAEKKGDAPPPADRDEPSAAQDAVEGRTSPTPTPPPPPVPPRAPPPAKGGPGGVGIVGLVIAAVIGGVIATILGIAYHASGVVPTRSETAAQEALTKVGDLSATVTALDKRLAAVEAAPAGPAATDVTDLTDKLAALEKLETENRARIEKLEAAPPPAAATPGESGASTAAITASLDDIKTRIAKLEADAASGADIARALSALTERVTALEASTKDLGTQLAAVAARPAESERAARAAAVAMLQQAVEAGGPFATDLAMLKAMGLDADDLAQLEPLAAKDTPSVAALKQQFPTVADAILVASATDDSDGGFLDGLAAFGRGLVTVRPTGAIPGDTPEAVVSRMQAAVDSGDLASALTERAKLPPEGQAASADWAQAAEDRVAINRLVDKLALSVTAPGN